MQCSCRICAVPLYTIKITINLIKYLYHDRTIKYSLINYFFGFVSSQYTHNVMTRTTTCQRPHKCNRIKNLKKYIVFPKFM